MYNFVKNQEIIPIVLFISFFSIWLFDIIGGQASGSFYDVAILSIGIFLPSILLFLGLLIKKPDSALVLFILIFPILPSVNNLLEAIGTGLLVALVELFISSAIYFSLQTKYKSQKFPIEIVLFSFLWAFCNFVSFLLSDMKISNLVGLILAFTFLFLLLSISIVVSEKRKEGINSMNKLIMSFVFSLFIFSVFASLVLFFNAGFEMFTSIFSLIRLEFSGYGYIDLNAVSGISLIALPLIFVYFFSSNTSLVGKFFLFLYALLICLLVLIDKSRGGFLTFMTIGFLLFFTNLFSRKSKNFKASDKFLIVILTLLFSIAFFYFASGIILARISGTEIGEALTLSDILINTIVSSRGEILLLGFEKFKESPIFGNGYGTLVFVESFNAMWDSHNQVLESLISVGLAGTLTFYFFLLYSYIRYRISAKFLSSEIRALQRNIWISISALLVFGLTTGLNLIDVGDRVSSFPIYIYGFLVVVSLNLSNMKETKDKSI